MLLKFTVLALMTSTALAGVHSHHQHPRREAAKDVTGCAKSEKLCQGSCVNLDKDQNNCGRCNRVCDPNTQVCKSGKCATRPSQPCKAGHYLEGGQCYAVLCNTVFTGFWVGQNSAIDVYDCAAQCSDYNKCIYAVFTPSTSECAFNSQLGDIQPHTGVVSAELVDISKCS